MYHIEIQNLALVMLFPLHYTFLPVKINIVTTASKIKTGLRHDRCYFIHLYSCSSSITVEK